MKSRSRPILIAVFILFLFSGAAGLAYEVIWTRMLVRTFGATTLAVSTVLAAYMAGLALGSYIFGRIIDKRGNPILVYGLLELGVGLFAIAFPFLISGLNPFYRAIYPDLSKSFYVLSIVRFLLCFGMLLVPTILMGGTLPVLSKYVSESLDDLTFRAGLLYAINTFGAVAGTFVTGFLLLPNLGMKLSTLSVVLVNVAIFAIAIALVRSEKARPLAIGIGSEESKPPVKIRWQEKVVLLAFLLTGLSALSAEVIWTRVLTLVVGTTVYAFSIMLIAFLLGLAIGSAIFARLAQRTTQPGRMFSILVIAIGFCIFASTVLFGKMPFAYMRIYESIAKTWSNLVWIQFLLSLALVLVSTLLMGGTFPLVARVYATDTARVGNRIGTAYAFNTVGSVIGSLMGTFFFLRLLGVRNGMVAVSAIYIGVGLLLWFAVAEKIGRAVRSGLAVAVVAAAAAVAVLSPKWDKKVMTSGIYVYAPLFGTMDNFLQDLERRNLLFYDEGPGATVSVDRTDNVISMRIDGKTDASSGSDMITQELISHLPLLFHPKPDTILLIGLGSGVSLSSALTHEVKYIECVELLENVITAAHYFDHLTRNSLSDPRALVIVGDGRNHVFLSNKKYDVIISQPTNPWISGVGDLFTLEFFTKARERLKPNGIMCAWFQTYHMGESELKSVFKTFMAVFPNVLLWFSNESDVILLGSLKPIEVKPDLMTRMNKLEVKEDLARVGIDEPEDILSALLLDGPALAEFIKGNVKIHTDDNMILEYQASRKIVESTHLTHLVNFSSLYRPKRFPDLPESVNNSVNRRMIARSMTMRGTIEILRGNPSSAISLYSQAYLAAPDDPYVRIKFAETHLRIADSHFAKGEYDKALEEYKKATVDQYYIDAWLAFDGLGLVQMMQEDYEEARASLEKASELNPYSADSYYNLGMVLVALGDSLAALEAYERAYELKPDDPDIANSVAWYNAVLGKDMDKALKIALGLVEKNKSPVYLDTLGWIYFLKGELDQALRTLEEAVSMDKDFVDALYHLAIVQQARGDTLAAKYLLQRVNNLDKGRVGGWQE